GDSAETSLSSTSRMAEPAEAELPNAPTSAGRQVVESDDPRVTRTSGWVPYTNPPGSSGGSYLVNIYGSDTLQLPFNGTGIEIVTVVGPGFGTFAVMIDGAEVRHVDTNVLSFEVGGRVTLTGLAAGDHLLEIRPLESVVAIDAF